MPDPEDLSPLFPANDVGQVSQQIDEDPDLFDMLIRLYDKSYGGFRSDVLKELRDKPGAARQATLRNIWKNDKGPRREFLVEARQFLSERAAGRSAESQRLARGQKNKPRTAATIEAARAATTGAQAATAAKTGASGRARSLLNEANRLGQSGALG